MGKIPMEKCFKQQTDDRTAGKGGFIFHAFTKSTDGGKKHLGYTCLDSCAARGVKSHNNKKSVHIWPIFIVQLQSMTQLASHTRFMRTKKETYLTTVQPDDL